MAGHPESSPVQQQKPANSPRIPTWVWAALSALASGGLMSACYWPLNFHWLAWIAMVPWLVMLPRVGSVSAWLCGTLLGLVFYRIGLAWLFGVHGLLAGTAIVVLAIWMGFSFRVARLLMEKCSAAAMLWAVPIAFAGQEILRSEGLPRYRFGFLAFGYSQSHNLWIAQIASLGGVYFISFLLAFVNVAIAWVIIRRRVRAWIPSLVAAACIVFLATASQPRLEHSPSIPVACVQAEVYNNQTYTDLARRALADTSKPRLLVLPEHTISDYATERHPLVHALADLAREHSAYVCVGAHVPVPRDAACDYDNVGMVIGPAGTILSRQAKGVPLPFFIDGNPARDFEVTPSPHGTLGVFVCYDGLFTDIPRRLAAKGAEVFLVPVMDPERWPLQERSQHADMAPFRSIELRRCAVRAASSGISQIIDATGRITARRTKEEGPGVLPGDVRLYRHATVFARWGWTFAWLIGAAYIGLIALLTIVIWRSGFTARQARPRLQLA